MLWIGRIFIYTTNTNFTQPTKNTLFKRYITINNSSNMIVFNTFSIIIVLLYTFFAVLKTYSAKPDIDQEHLLKVPNCGLIKTASDWYESPSSRLLNAKEATQHYPWVVRVIRYWRGKRLGRCGGSLLTKRLRHF